MNMSITRKTINGAEYEFINDCYGNRSGFVHESNLKKDGRFIGHNKCQYYNRTWEVYTYQTVMKGLVYNLMEELKESFKESWKESHGVKRLVESKRKLMMEDLEKMPSYMDLKELYSSL